MASISKKQQRSTQFNYNLKDSQFRISSNAKTLTSIASSELKKAKGNSQNNKPANQPQQFIASLHSCHISSPSQHSKNPSIQITKLADHHSSKVIPKYAKKIAFISSNSSPQSSNQSRKKNCYPSPIFEINEERDRNLQSIEGKLSLANFHERVKTMNVNHKNKADDNQLFCLKLEGVQFNCNDRYNTSGQFRKSDLRTKADFKYLKKAKTNDKKSNLNELSKILCRMNLDDEQVQNIEIQSMVGRPVNRSWIEKQKGGSQWVSKRQVNKEKVRQTAKVNIINISESKPQQDKARCHQIYMKYFLKSDDSIYKKNEEVAEKVPTQHDLLKQLSQIKKEIARRNLAVQQKSALQQQGRTKYTTSLIEEKLTKRKSLIKDYTFKRGIWQQKQHYALSDDFLLDPWEIHEGEVAN